MDTSKFTRPVNLRNIRLTGGFWKEKLELVRTEVIPYQWKAINDQVPGADPSYCLHNFKAAARVIARRKAGEDVPAGDAVTFERWPGDPSEAGDGFWGLAFQDTDAYKWIEAAAYSLTQHPDPALEATVDEAVDLICAAQEDDGYLDTFYILTDPSKRFTCLRTYHELYCFGHLAEGAAAYYEATGKRKLLDAACRYADCIMKYIGPEEGKRHGVPGHEIAEMALVRLYEATGRKEYLDLGQYFIDERGKAPNYFSLEADPRLGTSGAAPYDSFDEETWERMAYSYLQAHRPVREQTDAVGHAVRAVYLYSGMADYARLENDSSLKEACDTLWNSIVNRKMYVTGGLGGTHIGEAFSFDYDLPDDTAYAETCASVGMAFFARRMLQADPDSRYADVMERELYNGILSGIALDGKSFFYVNPLEVWPKACHCDVRKEHVFPVRQKWMTCACCPPNLARLVSSIGAYAVTENENTLYLHQYLDMELRKELADGEITLRVESGFPWNGRVRVHVKSTSGRPFALAFRLPGWCRNPKLPAFSEEKTVKEEKGYLYVSGVWMDEELEFDFPMEAQVLQADLRVRETAGKLAVQRGPVVYCLEEADNGPDLHRVYLAGDAAFSEQAMKIQDETVTALSAAGWRRAGDVPETGTGLYRPYAKPSYEPCELTFVPYYAWANRGENEMTVWVKEK